MKIRNFSAFFNKNLAKFLKNLKFIEKDEGAYTPIEYLYREWTVKSVQFSITTLIRGFIINFILSTLLDYKLTIFTVIALGLVPEVIKQFKDYWVR